MSIHYTRATPPTLLLHGTARRFLGRIWNQGLQRMGRQYVHLTDHVPPDYLRLYDDPPE